MVEPMMKKGEKEDSKERKSSATTGITEKSAGKQLDQRFIFQGRVSLLDIQELSLKVLTNKTSLALS